MSTPFNGFIPFLHVGEAGEVLTKAIVSMPFNGLSSFLLIFDDWDGAGSSSCQCPLTGLFHFYVIHGNLLGVTCNLVSMPLNGLSSFLRVIWTRKGASLFGLCQCPLTGFLHFCQKIILSLYLQKNKCQCP